MTDEEFRATIYKRMKEAERQRRMQGSVGIALIYCSLIIISIIIIIILLSLLSIIIIILLSLLSIII